MLLIPLEREEKQASVVTRRKRAKKLYFRFFLFSFFAFPLWRVNFSLTHLFNSFIQITHSFSRPYVPYDNSVVESFFASLKREELYRTKYRSESEFMLAVSDYMDFFNTKRPHRKLQYRTPEQKEHDYALNNGISAC